MFRSTLGIAFSFVIVLVQFEWAAGQDTDRDESSLLPASIGHSRHGTAFDVGPRQKPWQMDGIGKSHFPITTTVPEVQRWFDQGHTLLHSYWFYEAERAFRWCLKLDPDCAMAYWGLYRSMPGVDPSAAEPDKERAEAFLQEAVKRKHLVTDRERMYIEAWEARVSANMPFGYSAETIAAHTEFKQRLERIILKYPDDIEARALYANENLPRIVSADIRYANELVLREILEFDPQHPGALHYRIHNWDGPDGHIALPSCALYSRVAPNVGHALHMPGHVYASVGMWHEAAIAMASATRVETSYMRKRMIFPFQDWNYAHNLNYLCFNLEQLGRHEEALSIARPLLAAPRDPDYNNPENPEAFFLPVWEARAAVIRSLVQLERWDEILDGESLPWNDRLEDNIWKAYVESLADLGKGQMTQAARRRDDLVRLQEETTKSENSWPARHYAFQVKEVEGLLALANGRKDEGIELLREAAELELEMRKDNNDPSYYPRVVYNVLGDVLLEQIDPKAAIDAFETTLTVVRNDGIALAGLTKANAALGNAQAATQSYARLLHVWSDAQPGLRWWKEVQNLGLTAEPKDASLAKQRRYSSQDLDQFGQEMWQPHKAQQLEALDSHGKPVRLEQYRGKNVLLIFYLGEECPHCMEQLVAVKKLAGEFKRRNTEVLAISSSAPQENAASERLGKLGFRLLSDVDHANARRFHSYDDFEDMELHSTILIDGNGRVHWARTGGEPFEDLDFILAEIDRTNQ